MLSGMLGRLLSLWMRARGRGVLDEPSVSGEALPQGMVSPRLSVAQLRPLHLDHGREDLSNDTEGRALLSSGKAVRAGLVHAGLCVSSVNPPPPRLAPWDEPHG